MKPEEKRPEEKKKEKKRTQEKYARSDPNQPTVGNGR
jgi:hypothetical protein